MKVWEHTLQLLTSRFSTAKKPSNLHFQCFCLSCPGAELARINGYQKCFWLHPTVAVPANTYIKQNYSAHVIYFTPFLEEESAQGKVIQRARNDHKSEAFLLAACQYFVQMLAIALPSIKSVIIQGKWRRDLQNETF
jgi:hypothetical protein